MSEELEHRKPTDKAKEANEVEKKATQKESRENFTNEQQAKRYSDNFTSFSDGTPAVEPLVLHDSKTGEELYDADKRRKQQDVPSGSAENTGTVIDYKPKNGSGQEISSDGKGLQQHSRDEQTKLQGIKPWLNKQGNDVKEESVPKGSAEDIGKVTDYEWKRTGDRSVSTGMNWESMDSSDALKAVSKRNKALEPVEKLREYADHLPPGPQKDMLTKLSREQAAELSPEMREHYREKEALHAAKRISELPLNEQLQVLGAGLTAGLDQFEREERERAFGQLIGMVQGAGEVLTNLAKIADFCAYSIIGDNERAGKMGEEFGTAIGQTIVGGVRLFQAANKYLYDVGFAAGGNDDYVKAFLDVQALGQKLDESWSHLSPREQERIKSKLITEIAGDTAIGAGGAAAIKKATKFTEVLDAVAAQTTHGTKKAVKAIEEAVDELLLQPVGDTGYGNMPIPKQGRKIEDYASKIEKHKSEVEPIRGNRSNPKSANENEQRSKDGDGQEEPGVRHRDSERIEEVKERAKPELDDPFGRFGKKIAPETIGMQDRLWTLTSDLKIQGDDAHFFIEYIRSNQKTTNCYRDTIDRVARLARSYGAEKLEVTGQGFNPKLKDKISRWYADTFEDLGDKGYRFTIDLRKRE